MVCSSYSTGGFELLSGPPQAVKRKQMVAAVAAAQGIPWATGHGPHTPSFKLRVTKQLPAQRAEGRQVL